MDPDNVEAEFVIIVRSDLKGKGPGQLLMRKMIDFLSSRGTQRLVAYVLRENEAMRELGRSHGLSVRADLSDEEALYFALALPVLPDATGVSSHGRYLIAIQVLFEQVEHLLRQRRG